MMQTCYLVASECCNLFGCLYNISFPFLLNLFMLHFAPSQQILISVDKLMLTSLSLSAENEGFKWKMHRSWGKCATLSLVNAAISLVIYIPYLFFFFLIFFCPRFCSYPSMVWVWVDKPMLARSHRPRLLPLSFLSFSSRNYSYKAYLCVI